MKRIVVAVGAAIALIGFSVIMGGAASGATETPTGPVITFDDAAHQAQLVIPTPACSESQPDCQWKFFLNEPKLSIDVATVFGTSGTLTIAYPKNFCGVIQADAYVGPPFVAKRGFQHTIEDCNPPTTTTTTTTTTAPPTTTTTAPPMPVSAPVKSAPPPVATTTPPVASSPTALPFSAPASTPASTPAAVPAAPTQLAFTGVNVMPFLLTGLMLVALGLFLLTTAESRRRVTRRLLAISSPAYSSLISLKRMRSGADVPTREFVPTACGAVHEMGTWPSVSRAMSASNSRWARLSRFRRSLTTGLRPMSARFRGPWWMPLAVKVGPVPATAWINCRDGPLLGTLGRCGSPRDAFSRALAHPVVARRVVSRQFRALF